MEEVCTVTAGLPLLTEREAARVSAQHEPLVLKERGDGLTRRIQELDDELARATERLGDLTARDGDLRRQLAVLEGEVGARVAAKDEREATLAALEGELKEMRHEAAGVKQIALDLFQAESQARSEGERARERLSNLAERREAAQVALTALAERLAEVSATRDALGGELSAHEGTLTQARAHEGELLARGQELEAQGARCAEDESALRAQAAASASRLATLEELKRAYEGVDA